MTASLPAPHPWVETVLRPLALAAMAGCVALPLSQMVVELAPNLHRPLLLAACVLAALEVNFSHRLLRRQFTSGDDVLRFRMVEIGFGYILLKITSLVLNGGGLALNTGDTLIVNVQHALASLLDLETLLALALAGMFGLTVEDTLSTFDQLGESPQAELRNFSPLERLTGQFFFGGAVLLVLSGLARVGLAEMFNFTRPAIAGIVANVLVYFLLGLLLLSQVHYQRLSARWQAQGVRPPPELARRWVGYTLALVLVAGLAAFALPTGYTAGAFDVFGQALLLAAVVVWSLVALLAALVAVPLALIMALLAGAALPVGRIKVVPPPNVPELLQKPLPAWIDTLRTIAVVALVAGMVLYVVVNYLRDRTGWAEALRRLELARGLRRLWAALRHRAGGLAALVRDSAPLAWLRDRLRRAAPPGSGYFRLGAASAREQVMFYYLSLLRRARERGFGRRPPQTPREYEPVLEQALPEAAGDLAELTAAFEETRYSAHPVGPEAAQAARSRWGRVREALRRRKAGV